MKLLNVKQVAELTGFSQTHIRTLIRNKKIPTQRVGIQYLINDTQIKKIKSLRVRRLKGYKNKTG